MEALNLKSLVSGVLEAKFALSLSPLATEPDTSAEQPIHTRPIPPVSK